MQRLRELTLAFAGSPHQATQRRNHVVRMPMPASASRAPAVASMSNTGEDVFAVYELSRTESVTSEAAVLVGVLLPRQKDHGPPLEELDGLGRNGGRAGGRPADPAPRGPRCRHLSRPRQGRGTDARWPPPKTPTW